MQDDIGNWRIRDFAPGEGLVAKATAGEGAGWIGATAPGDTYQALIAAGRIADPYKARNEAAAAWVRDREWWWHVALDLAASADGETVTLECGGLDTFADVYLDGRLLGRTDNMFRTWRFDLGEVAAGRHDLAFCFHPPAIMTGDAPLPVWGSFTDRVSRSRRTAMRKAQFGWGWDWGPDLPTVGVWRPVRIARARGAVVRSVNFSTLALDENRAEVRVDIDLSATAAVTIELLDPDGARVATAVRDGSGSVSLTVPDPQLWWSAGLGAQPLYTLVARIAAAPDHVRKVGIRTIAIDQSPDPDEPGTTFFRFMLNGVPVFAKGANWVPASSWVGAIPDETYRDLLERAVAANMNMIRVWGGGIYEPDLFYDECDRLGLLVWQDFMFACAPYPEDDPGFVENIRHEVAEQVARLRHHACLALWCGNNENQAIHWFNDIAGGVPTLLEGQLYYDELIPAALARLDPDTPYWPGSPWGGPTPNSMRGGDEHNWTVWHGVAPVPDTDPAGPFDTSPAGIAYTRYAEDTARFVSEFGLQGSADIGTLGRWMAPEDMVLDSAGLIERIKDVADKASAMMIPVTGLPSDLEAFVDFTMLAQAEGLKFGIEHYRRRMPHCSGALIWQHNDCWPCVSWSLIDYDGVAKAAYHAVTRAFAPVMASIRRDGDQVELWVVNDTLEPVSYIATIALARLAGGEDWREDVPFTVPANRSRCVWSGIAPESPDCVVIVRSLGGAFPGNRLLPTAVKDLGLAGPELSFVTEPRGDALAVLITARRYAVSVRLSADAPDIRFEDNYFDLAEGEIRTVLVRRANGPVAADMLRIDSLKDRLNPAARTEEPKMRDLISAALLAAAPFAACPAVAQAAPPMIGAVADPCVHVDPMPPEVAGYFAAVIKAQADKTAAPVPTAAQLGLYRDWQARVRQQDFAQSCKYAAANAALPAPSDRRVVFFGDSITELWGYNDPAFFGGDTINRGISGQTTVQMLGRFRADVIELKPQVVHIIAGTNDVAGNTGPTSVDRIVGNIASMVDLAKLHGIRVVLGSELPCARFAANPQVEPVPILRELNERLRTLAKAQGIEFVDYFTPLADADAAFDARFSDDGLHPTRAGYSVMAPLALAAVSRAARRERAAP